MPRQNKIILRNGTTTPNAGDFDIGEPAWDKTAGKLYVKNDAGSMVDIGSGGASFTGGTLTSNLTVASGTTSLSPLTFQAGTNLTNATAGTVEYDGNVFYSTPSARGITPSLLTYRLNANLAGQAVTTSQNIFGVGATVNASTIYGFRVVGTIAKTSGTGSHSVSLGFDNSTATFDNLHAQGFYQNIQAAPNASSTTATASLNYGVHTSEATLTYVNGVSGATRTGTFLLSGSFSVNAGGTFTPVFKISSTTAGIYSALAGSYMEIWPMGAAGSNISVGPWA